MLEVLESRSQLQLGSVAIRRGSQYNHSPSFIVQDGKYVSGRWAGDAYKFSERFCELVLGELNRSELLTGSAERHVGEERISGLGFDAEDFADDE